MLKQNDSLKNKVVLGMAVWVALVSGSFIWNTIEAGRARDEIALQTAKSFFELIVITRTWSSQHGSVYVPVTESTQPNPYLDEPGRDLHISRSLTLTKINPAYMTRQLSEIAAKQTGIKFHITSLLPIRPENAPSPRERQALESFEKGEKETGQFFTEKSVDTFFYIAPLKTEKACLQCHAKQGYKEGDIRGGISVTLPFSQKIPLVTLAAGHLGIGLAGIAGILFFGAKLRVEISERKRGEEALRESEERFKKLFIEAPLGIAMIDSLTGQIYEVNTMFAKIAGRTIEEMANIDWMTITHPDDLQKDLDNMVLLNAGKIPGFQMEKRYLHNDGAAVWINMTIAPLYGEDKTHPRHLCMIEDITERKHAEEELSRYAAELEKSNHELKEALANVKTLSGMLPICASCKKIRDDKGYWSGVESYITNHSEVLFSHGICPDCEKKMYEELEKLKNENS